MTQTTDRLAAELRKVGLELMARKAEAGHYDDYLSELTFPIAALVGDLEAAGTPAARELAQRARDGDFDATEEEADAWERSRKR